MQNFCGGRDDFGGNASVVSRMGGIFDDDKLAAWPGLVQFPSRNQWCLEIEAPLDQDSRYAGKRCGTLQQLPVGKPCIVVEIMCDDPRTGQ